MARTECRCGEVLSITAVPNDVQLRVYTDIEWVEIEKNDMVEMWEFPLPKYDVWKCPKCERIYVYGKGNNSPLKVYALE